jgi:hypothetical protein
MPWPTSQEYNEAVQFPATHFADPDLCQGQAVTDTRRMPLPCAGNFADVYHLRCPGGEWAIKCFTREVPGLRERYPAISAHLRQAGVPFLVDCQYLDPGIRVLGAWYPVVKMRWVDGVPLNAFVRDHLDRPDVLQELLRIWLDMARRLRAAGIAHGNLQHGTVLGVSGGAGGSPTVRLIGYGGMYVPALAGQRPGKVGHPNYQHPQRLREGTSAPEVDRFALLLVATALCCLRIAGRPLWERYDNGDNLLFKATDFTSPDQSPLFAELLKLPDPEARAVVALLMAACQKPLEQTSLLEEVFPEKPPAPAVAPAGAGQKSLDQAPRLEPALARKEERPWWEDALNAAGRSDAPAPAFEGNKQLPWWEGPLAPRAADSTAPPIAIAPPAPPPALVEEPPPAPLPLSLPDASQAAPRENAATEYERHPDYEGNLEKKSIGALVFGWALLLALVVGCVVLLKMYLGRDHAQEETRLVAADKPPPPIAPEPGKDRKRDGRPDGAKKVPVQKYLALSCEDLCEKEKKRASTLAVNAWSLVAYSHCCQAIGAGPAPYVLGIAEWMIPAHQGEKVTVAGRVTQEGTTHPGISGPWRVKPEVTFVGLGDNGKGDPLVYCVFPTRPDLAAWKGKNCCIKGTCRGTVKRLGDTVPLLIECEPPQDP